jgi:4,5:9,10-diseco-3-hydroxy-5,9,17-trioxoandrosta-1(10),2-diene-4-oate hydrolase
MSEREIASQFVEVDGLRLHYNQCGEGPALIFLHGGGPGASGLSNFSRNMQAFGDRYRTIALDLPGYGQSTKLEIDAPIFEYYAGVVAAFIDALGLGSASLLGNSLGGGTALKAALDYPTKVDKLVLMGPAGGYSVLGATPSEGVMSLLTFYEPPGPSLERLRAFIKYLVYDPSTISDELLAQRLEKATAPETAKYMPLRLRRDRPVRGTDLWRERLDQIQHETLIIWGREDRVNLLDQSLLLAKQIPNARLLVLPKCGHWAQWEKADEFNRIVGDFLDH